MEMLDELLDDGIGADELGYPTTHQRPPPLQPAASTSHHQLLQGVLHGGNLVAPAAAPETGPLEPPPTGHVQSSID